MKQQETMIGNYAHAFGGGDGFSWRNAKRYLAQVTSVAKWGISYDILDNKPETYHTHFEPIQLDEEWLVKFGWIWNKDTNSFEKYPNGDARMHLQYRYVSNSYTMFNYVLKAMICERIFYVHQLQNLYFSLTGEKLTITHGS